MKSPIIPLSCATALALMTAATGSHWWSVRGFVAAVHDNPLLASVGAPATPAPPAPAVVTQPAPPTSDPAPAANPPQKAPEGVQQFYASLLAELRSIRQENTTLRNQMAEANRDLLNLQFEVDSHSRQFRPLRVQDESPDYQEPEILTDPPILDDNPGVLPPRSDIAGLPGLPGQ